MPDARWGDPREYGERDRGDERPRVYDERDRDDHDPRDALMQDLDLPRGEERELVVDRDRVYELNGEDGRTLATVGTFRVVPEQDLEINRGTADHLRDEGLVETVNLGDDERGLTLTKAGRDLLDSHTLERDGEGPQAFHAGVGRPREIDHDSNLYSTYRQEESRLRDAHGDLQIHRVILEQDLKREYQEFLQDHNRTAPTATDEPIAAPRNPRLGARARPAVLRRPGALPRLTASSARLTAADTTRTSSCSRPTTAALMPPAGRRRASASNTVHHAGVIQGTQRAHNLHTRPARETTQCDKRAFFLGKMVNMESNRKDFLLPSRPSCASQSSRLGQSFELRKFFPDVVSGVLDNEAGLV